MAVAAVCCGQISEGNNLKEGIIVAHGFRGVGPIVRYATVVQFTL